MLFDDIHSFSHEAYRIRHNALGALVGQAVGDALGARYEFGPPGEISKHFPKGVPCRHLGGGSFGWRIGEFTDDTQMAVLLAEQLVSGWDPEKMWTQWSEWAKTAKDVGTTTRPPLSAESYLHGQSRRSPRGRGNGAVMRVAPVGIVGAVKGAQWTEKVARAQAQITHIDPRTVEASVICAVVLAELISNRREFEDAIQFAIQWHCDVEKCDYFTDLLLNDNMPLDESNGYGDICLAEAIHAVRRQNNYEDTIRYAIDGGNDTDTVACVAGALAGALYGVQSIPARLTTPLNGVANGKHYDLEKLESLAVKMIGQQWKQKSPSYNGSPEPTVIAEKNGQRVLVSNLSGVAISNDDYACMSFCRTFGETDHYPYRRSFYLLDESDPEANPNIDDVVRDAIVEINEALDGGHDVVIHCHAGESRTGLIAKAWLMSAYGWSHEEAHDHLKSKWRYYSPRNTAFVRFLDAFHEQPVSVG